MASKPLDHLAVNPNRHLQRPTQLSNGGRLLQFLGHERAEHPRSGCSLELAAFLLTGDILVGATSGSNTERAAEAQVRAMAAPSGRCLVTSLFFN